MQYTLTPTPAVSAFLVAVQNGAKPRDAAREHGLTVAESALVRRMAGLPVQRYASDITDQVTSLRTTGMTYAQISQMLGISTSYVNHILTQSRKVISQ